MITIVNLKTNLTGQVADHIGLDDKLLASQGYARIETPQMPVYSEPSMTLDQEPLTSKHFQEFQENVEVELTKQKEWLGAEPIPITIMTKQANEFEKDIEESTKSLISKGADQMARIKVKKTRKKRTTKNKNT